MAQEDVEAVRRAAQAWNTEDLDAFLAELDPEVEWHPSIEPAFEGGETIYRGHDGARKAWDDLGESALVLGHIDLTARTTGIRFHEEVGQLGTFRDGRIATVHDYLSHREALEAAGLSEQGGGVTGGRASFTSAAIAPLRDIVGNRLPIVGSDAGGGFP